jgi:DNA (cytosine-5)-methyltransferase 1
MKTACNQSPKKRLTVVDLFCGAGGLSSGFSAARGIRGEQYEIVYAVDHDRQAMQTFRANHFNDSDKTVRGCCDEIDEVHASQILSAIQPQTEVDVLIGGPSCQGVSPAGLRNPDDKRNQMILAFVRLVKELRPKWFVMENVPGLTHQNNRELLAEVLKLLGKIKGYQVAGDVLLAADYGVPQFRYRLFLIGTRTGGPIRFPSPSFFPPNEAGQECYKTVLDAIGDLARIKPTELDPGENPISRHGMVPNHCCRQITEINRRRIATVRRGYDWRDIPIKLLPARYFTTRSSDQKGSYGRLAWDWPAYTVTNSSLNITAGAFTHPDHDRCLSVREAARLQSFPDDYVFHGSLEAQYRQVGNAVPPLLAKAVAETILNSHFRPKQAARSKGVGRLTLEAIQNSIKTGGDLPTLTPRFPNPAVARGTTNKNAGDAPKQDPSKILCRRVWGLAVRPPDPWPEATRRLRMLADQPKNVRAAKRARAIVQFIDGVPREKIIATARASEASVSKWVEGYFADGAEGWRAFHSRHDQLASGNRNLEQAIHRKVARARRLLLSPTKTAQTPELRLHMNGYLRDLIAQFGRLSVAQLIEIVETWIDGRIGTVYVGDLLAIADAVFSQPYRAPRRIA